MTNVRPEAEVINFFESLPRPAQVKMLRMAHEWVRGAPIAERRAAVVDWLIACGDRLVIYQHRILKIRKPDWEETIV